MCVCVVQVAANEPVLTVGADHVLDVGDAAALRARRVGRAVVNRVPWHALVAELAGLDHAKGADREQLLALLLGRGRHRVGVALPVCERARRAPVRGWVVVRVWAARCALRTSAVVALARRARVVAAALDAAERHPGVGRLGFRASLEVRPHTVARGAVLDEAVAQLEHELVPARLAVEEQALVPRDEHAARSRSRAARAGAGAPTRRPARPRAAAAAAATAGARAA